MKLTEKKALEITIDTFEKASLLSDNVLEKYECLTDLKLYCNPELCEFECACALCEYYRKHSHKCKACPLESCNKGIYTEAWVSLASGYYKEFRANCVSIVSKCKRRLAELESNKGSST